MGPKLIAQVTPTLETPGSLTFSIPSPLAFEMPYGLIMDHFRWSTPAHIGLPMADFSAYFMFKDRDFEDRAGVKPHIVFEHKSGRTNEVTCDPQTRLRMVDASHEHKEQAVMAYQNFLKQLATHFIVRPK